MPESGRSPCVFFDRDGVVNVSPGAGYVTQWEEFRFQPGIFDCLQVVKDRGYASVLVTSQRCVVKGLISLAGLAEIHQQMQSVLRERELEFLDIYAFTGLPETEDWEKPSPTMIQLAAEAHTLDLSRSWLIGDHDRDILMARAAGVSKTVRVIGEKAVGVEADFAVASIGEATDIFKQHL